MAIRVKYILFIVLFLYNFGHQYVRAEKDDEGLIGDGGGKDGLKVVEDLDNTLKASAGNVEKVGKVMKEKHEKIKEKKKDGVIGSALSKTTKGIVGKTERIGKGVTGKVVKEKPINVEENDGSLKAGSDEATEANLQAESEESGDDEESSGGSRRGADGFDAKAQAKKIGDAIKEKFEKAKKRKTPLAGNTGKVMKIVLETVKQINPIRLLQRVDPDPLLMIHGVDVNKLKLPSTIFSDTFFDKFSKKTGISKEDLSTDLGADVVHRKEGEMINLGHVLKVGKKKDLRLGDYLHFLGLDLTQYEKKYDDLMIESVRRPVEVIDELLTDGFKDYISKITTYVNKNGGPMNAALQYYQDLTGKDPLKQAQKAFHDFKKQSQNTLKDREGKIRNLYSKQVKGWEEYMKEGEKHYTSYYDKAFGEKGMAIQWQGKLLKTAKHLTKFFFAVINRKRVKDFVDLFGHTIGPTGRAIVFIAYRPTVTYMMQLFGPFILIPRIMLADMGQYDCWEKLFSLPPAILIMSGNLFKPSLIIWEPVLRWVRFMATGEYMKSLNAGRELSARFGMTATVVAKVSAHSPSPKKRPKRDLKDQIEKGLDPYKKIKIDPVKFIPAKDQKLVDAYHGAPPHNGHDLGLKISGGKLDIDEHDFVSRFLLSPDFLMKAGGPVFAPLASVLAPLFRAFNRVFFAKGAWNKRVAEVPKIIKGAGIIGPFADVIEALLPIVDIVYQINQGGVTPAQIVVQAPGLAKKLTGGVLWEVARKPDNFLKAVLVWLDGSGGILGVQKLQYDLGLPKHTVGDFNADLIDESNFLMDYMGEFTGGWFLGYVQAMGPVISTVGALFNGILGNIINPLKLVDSDIDLKNHPLKHLIQTLDNLPELMKIHEDRRTFTMALLGGHDPEPLHKIGIDSGMLAQHGIDPALLIAAGKKLLPPAAQQKLAKESGLSALGVNSQHLSKVNVDIKAFLEHGLIDANHNKLHEAGIDMLTIINRVMRGSIEDDIKLKNAGLDIKKMLKAGIDPAKFIAGGIGALPEATIKQLGVNKNQLSDENLKKLGITSAKLHSKGIDPKKFAEKGAEPFIKLQGTFGINVHVLMSSMFIGLDNKRLLKSGIDLRVMVREGVDTKLLILGGLAKHLKNDLSEKSVSKIGINLKVLSKTGINIKLLAEAGAGVLSPIQMVKLGIDPMRAMIGTLSQHGLDTLTGGYDDPKGITIGVASTAVQIALSMIGGISTVRSIKYGDNVIGPDGRFTGWAGLVFYKIIGIDAFGGLNGFVRACVTQKVTMSEMLQLLNPVRIVKEFAYPDAPTSFRRRKDSRRIVSDDIEHVSHGVAQAGGDEEEDSSGAKLPVDSKIFKKALNVANVVPGVFGGGSKASSEGEDGDD